MTTRRSFIKTLAAIPPALSFGHSWAASAAADPSRLALIIGNSAYQDAPLVNPANDAKAVAGLFTQAGFTVDSRLNATRTDMMAAIERFGTAVKRSDAKLVVFYYAGHGAQLDWRNYLLPVDAVVKKQEDMKQRCVDLSLLLGQFSAAKDKTFVVILDACRNNPFGTAYRPLYHAALAWYELWGGRDKSPVDPDMVSPEAYAEEILARQVATRLAVTRQVHTPEEFRAWLDSVAQFSDKIPPLPETISREWIYQDHD